MCWGEHEPQPIPSQIYPGNAGWQRDLSVPYEKIGDVLKAQGKLA